MRFRVPLLLRLLVLALALLAGCASGPRSVHIPQGQLQSALERRFPYEARPGGLFSFAVGVPRLQLLPESDRLRLDFLVEASEGLVGSALRGELAMSFGVRYDPADATLRAAGVRIDAIDVAGLPPPWRRPLRLAGALVAEQMLEGMVLHALRPEDLARARGWTPGRIDVTPRGVRIELLPPAAAR